MMNDCNTNDPFNCGFDFCGGMLSESMKSMFKRFQYFMPYDLEESDEYYFVTMAVPGFDANDLDVSVKGSEILVEAKSNPKVPEMEGYDNESKNDVVNMNKYIWMKPNIEVKIPVDREIDTDNVKAKLSKGVLMLRFKKIQGKKIDIEE